MHLNVAKLTRLMKKSDQKIQVKIEVLNSNEQMIGTIEGLCVSGSLSVSNSSLVRRTLDLTLIYNKTTEIKPESFIWINRRLRVFIGSMYSNGEIEWFKMGIFVISNPNESISVSGEFIRITAYDKMQLMKNDMFANSIINPNTPWHEAIKATAALGGETKFIFDTTTGFKIPYKQEINHDEEIIDVLQNLLELYMGYELYYNLDGYMVLSKRVDNPNDAVMWEFSEDKTSLHTTRDITYDFESIKNHFKIFGAQLEDGTQPVYELSITDESNDFCISKIGDRKLSKTYDKYTTKEQCRLMAEYQKEQCLKLQRAFTLTCSPIYMLNEVNKLIKVYRHGEENLCSIDSLTIPLGTGTMQIVAHTL